MVVDLLLLHTEQKAAAMEQNRHRHRDVDAHETNDTTSPGVVVVVVMDHADFGDDFSEEEVVNRTVTALLSTILPPHADVPLIDRNEARTMAAMMIPMAMFRVLSYQLRIPVLDPAAHHRRSSSSQQQAAVEDPSVC